jgi:hypothetical protein
VGRFSRHIIVAVAVLVAGCPQEPRAPTEASGHFPAPQLYLREPDVSAALVKQPFGADCRQAGAAQCESGRCIHSGVVPNDVYRCAQECVSQASCPPGSTCLVESSEEGGLCVLNAEAAAE